MLQRTWQCKMFLYGSFGREPQSPQGWHLQASVSQTSASGNWTSSLNSLSLERRGIADWIVLQVKGTKPIVKLVTRVLLASQ